jgi:hypothetical protein
MSNRNYAARSGAIAFASARTSPPRPGIRGALGRIAAFFTAQAEARARSRQARESVRRLLLAAYGPAGQRRLGFDRGR